MEDLRINLIRRLEREKKKAITIKSSANDTKFNYDALIDGYDKLLYTQYAELSKDIEQELDIFEKLKRD